MQWARINKSPGFTIVELLVVIVVVAILAVVVIVAYNGVLDRAKASAAQSAASQAVKKVMAYAVENADQYPATLAAASIAPSGDTTFQYSYSNTVPRSFCVTATTSNVSYYVSNTQTTPQSGGCAGHNANGVNTITNLAINGNLELNASGWAAAGSGSTTLTRVTSEFHGGAASLRVVPDGTVSLQGTFISVTYRSTVAPNTTYTASVWLKGEAGKNMRIEFGEWDGSLALVGRTNSSTVAGTGAWQRFTVTRTMGATAATADIVVRNTTAIANTIYIDDAMITAGSSAYTYADGNSPNWVWNGAANASTSTGLPL